jgi:hypothetical protein
MIPFFRWASFLLPTFASKLVAALLPRHLSANGPFDVVYGKHLRVDHSKDEFAKGRNLINGIVGFWGHAKRGWFASAACRPAPLT